MRVKLSAAAPTVFTAAIRHEREQRGMSLSEAARRAGITKAHLHDLESGRSRNPCVSTLAGLTKAYLCEVGALANIAAFSLAEGAPAGRTALSQHEDGEA